MLQPTFESSYVAQKGQQRLVTLPDGTELAMDTDTQAQVTMYRDRREVRIADGQIMFSVAADPKKPFHVLAGPARVTVLGTRFSVRYRNQGPMPGLSMFRWRRAMYGSPVPTAPPARRLICLSNCWQDKA
jgi:transmembrane sensor